MSQTNDDDGNGNGSSSSTSSSAYSAPDLSQSNILATYYIVWKDETGYGFEPYTYSKGIIQIIPNGTSSIVLPPADERGEIPCTAFMTYGSWECKFSCRYSPEADSFDGFEMEKMNEDLNESTEGGDTWPSLRALEKQ